MLKFIQTTLYKNNALIEKFGMKLSDSVNSNRKLSIIMSKYIDYKIKADLEIANKFDLNNFLFIFNVCR